MRDGEAGRLANHLHPEITSEDDLLPPGAEPGTVPTDLEQSTGLERLEILGKMQGVDVFDMRPLDASRLGTKDLSFIVGDWRLDKGPHVPISLGSHFAKESIH